MVAVFNAVQPARGSVATPADASNAFATAGGSPHRHLNIDTDTSKGLPLADAGDGAIRPVALTATSVLLVVALGACTAVQSPRVAQPLPPPRIAEPIEFLLGTEQGQFRAVPGSGDAAAGVLYRYQLYSHCGLAYPLAWDFDGSFWDPVGGGEPYSNPPEGIVEGLTMGPSSSSARIRRATRVVQA